MVTRFGAPPPANKTAHILGLALAGVRGRQRGLTLDELAARYRDDFLGFVEILEIVPKDGKRRRFELNDIQRAYCAARTARDVVLKARQVGFTTLEQARDVWFFLTRPGARVVVTCQSITDHGPLTLLSKNYRVFFDALRKAGVQLKFRTEATSTWELADHDASLRIVEAGASEAAAQKKGRAGTISRLHMTETAFYEYAAETLNALLECVPAPEDGSEITSESTPNGARGTFYEQWKASRAERSGFRAHFFPWFAQSEYCLPLDPGEDLGPTTDREQQLVAAGVRPDQLKWYRRKLAEKNGDQQKTDQEYPSDDKTCFLVSGRQFFDLAVTERLLAAARPPLERHVVKRAGADGVLKVFHLPEPGRSYIVPVDTSEGEGGDAGVAKVYERATGRHMATLWGQFKPAELATEAALLGHRFGRALIVVERMNHGHAVLQELAREDPEHLGARRKRAYPALFRDTDGKLGWLSTGVSRPAALDALEQAHREGVWTTNDTDSLGEYRTFVTTLNREAKARSAAKGGAHDDLVMTDAIAFDVLRRPLARVNRSYDNLPPA